MPVEPSAKAAFTAWMCDKNTPRCNRDCGACEAHDLLDAALVEARQPVDWAEFRRVIGPPVRPPLRVLYDDGRELVTRADYAVLREAYERIWRFAYPRERKPCPTCGAEPRPVGKGGAWGTGHGCPFDADGDGEKEGT